MNKSKKILCICNKGNVRSVATKYCLNRRGYWDVINLGGAVVSKETMNFLCAWADKILLAKPEHVVHVAKNFHEKIVKSFVIGNDIWGTPLNLHLEEIINKQLDSVGII